ncbi:MAG: hypothetical protein IKQ30_12950 [Bacteroidales bacterium]|nr:hypothetical protein [Bacteroidales bacterium]
MSEEATTTKSSMKNPDAPPRTREEILAWLDRARQRKEQHQREIRERYAEEVRRGSCNVQ